MAITQYTGGTGAGKSYGVTEHIVLPSIQQGRPIVTNIPLEKDELRAYAYENGYPEPDIQELDLTRANDEPAYLLSFAPGSVFILDECWELWGAGQKVNGVPFEHKEFLKKHRHRVGASGFTDEIILISQSSSDLARWVNLLVKEEYQAVKLDHVGTPDRYRVDVWSASLACKDKKPKILRTLYGKYDPKVYRFYTSQTQKADDNWGHGKEVKVDARANVWKSARIKYGVPFAVVAVFLGLFTLKGAVTRLFHLEEAKPEPVKVAPPPRPYIKAVEHPAYETAPAPLPEKVNVTLPEPAKTQPSRTAETFSTKWRLAAVMEKDSGEKSFYIIGRTGLRAVPSADCYLVDSIQEYRCSVDGEVVSTWTGQSMAVFGNTAIEGADM